MVLPWDIYIYIYIYIPYLNTVTHVWAFMVLFHCPQLAGWYLPWEDASVAIYSGHMWPMRISFFQRSLTISVHSYKGKRMLRTRSVQEDSEKVMCFMLAVTWRQCFDVARWSGMVTTDDHAHSMVDVYGQQRDLKWVDRVFQKSYSRRIQLRICYNWFRRLLGTNGHKAFIGTNDWLTASKAYTKVSWSCFPWASCQIRQIAGAHAPGMPGTFSPPPRVSNPDMHHGTCVTHVPWCMPGLLTRVFLWIQRRGETFPAFPAHAQPAILRIR